MRKVSTFGQTTNNNANSNDVGKVTPIKPEIPTIKKKYEGWHVIILGNGFDLYLNRKTKFEHFYDDDKYCPKNYDAPLIHFLNQQIKEKTKTYYRWYDFENELLNYTESDDFKANQYFVSDNYKRDFEAFKLIKTGLRDYMSEITQNEDSLNINYLINKYFPYDTEEHRVIYSFNYTGIPSILGGSDKDSEFHFVHGSCAFDNIILGTCEKKDLPEKYWFLQKVFDPNYNPDYSATDLLSASKVTFFGHSLGYNDRPYFEAFFKRQCDSEKAKKDMEINIFTYDDDSVMKIKHSLQKLTDYHLSDLYEYSSKFRIVTTKGKEAGLL